MPDAALGRGLQAEFDRVFCPQEVHGLRGRQIRTPSQRAVVPRETKELD